VICLFKIPRTVKEKWMFLIHAFDKHALESTSKEKHSRFLSRNKSWSSYAKKDEDMQSIKLLAKYREY